MNKRRDHASGKRASTCLAMAAATGFLLSACGTQPQAPVVLESARTLSPDAQWEVTVERVEDPSRFGAAYHEVHVHQPNAGIELHGNHDGSVVFYIRSDHRAHDRPFVEWTDATTLRIRYPNASVPGKMATRFANVGIRYETFSLPLSCTEALL